MGTYYRTRPSFQFGGFSISPAVNALLIINTVLFLIPELLEIGGHIPWVGLVPRLALSGMVWQFFTYMFFHGGFSHWLFNMLTLWMFGSAVEQTWGTRRFTTYYLSCGVAAGVCVAVMALISGGQALRVATIGSSGAIFGLILAFGMLFPDAPVLVMLIFPMPAKYFAVLMGFIEFFMQRTQPGSNVSHIAHLGGMAFGYFFIRFYVRRRRPGRPGYYDAPSPRRGRFEWRDAYRKWKTQRMRKKFEVYMREREEREREGGPGRWVN